jgi:hypothetical protein
VFEAVAADDVAEGEDLAVGFFQNFGKDVEADD